MPPTRTGFVGAGFISDTHAAALRTVPDVTLAAAVDPVPGRTDAFARKWGIPAIFESVDALVAARAIDAAHVLVPPPAHREVAQKLLRSGIHVLLEKPMAPSSADCALLQDEAARSGALLRVNHNAVEQPAHQAARSLIVANRIGPLRHIACRFNLPLRQLTARQFSHWMFNAPLNLLLEQAVHPLSQIDDLVGPVQDVSVSTADPVGIGEGRRLIRTWFVSMKCLRGTAQLQFSLGETYPNWGMTITGSDGVLHVDYLANRVVSEVSGPHMDMIDTCANGLRMAGGIAWQAAANFLRLAGATVGMRGRADPFFVSMRGSIMRFHHDLRSGGGERTGSDGRRLIELCEKIAAAGPAPCATPPKPPMPSIRHDVLVIGGTGFIGTHLVERLVGKGLRVGVLARNITNLPDIFADPHVALFRGDARNPDDIARAIGSASCIVNLAHGGGGGSRAQVEASLVGAAVTAAQGCLAAGGVRRLLFVSSIASLYLGDPGETITGATPSDPLAERRADYARAKALAERALLELHRSRGLPVTILRPGVVVGRGGPAFHSGIGFYNHETICLGWNGGRNPLPLVLVGEVAEAIDRAVTAPGIEGKCYNIVGDIRLTAREYIAELARVTHRPLRYRPQAVLKLYAIEVAKSVIKRASGRRDSMPSLRDLKSRGLMAKFDCSDAMRDLGWEPIRSRDAFLEQGFAVHGHAG